MKATPKKVEKLFDELNRLAFAGRIQKGFRFKCTPSTRFAGCVVWKPWEVSIFKISSRMNFTPESFRSVVAHETLHTYIIQNLRQDNRHGDIFRMLAEHLNRDHGLGIKISDSFELMEPRRRWLLVWTDPTGKRFMKPMNRYRLGDLHSLKNGGVSTEVYLGDENSIPGMRSSIDIRALSRCHQAYRFDEEAVRGLTLVERSVPSGEGTKPYRREPEQFKFDF